jgi:glucosamine--fructose-6-phosphate aminotransferase (isomerizing)
MSLRDEIFEQPEVLSGFLKHETENVRTIAESLRRSDIEFIFLAARGTSDNAGLYAKYLWGAQNHLPIALAAPSLFSVYAAPPSLKNALLVGISQSGQSPDIVSVLKEGQRQGAPTLAITNDPQSPLAEIADYVIDIHAGRERAVAATKTYTAQLMAIAALSTALSAAAAPWHTLKQVPKLVEKTLKLDALIEQEAERYRYMEHCVVLGRGYNYATAFEWALKLKELTYVVAEPYSSADFQHGPVAMVSQGFPVLAVVPGGAVFKHMLKLLSSLVKQQKSELVVISNDDEALSLAHTPFKLPEGVDEWISPIIAIVAAQLFTYHLTRDKGFDTESPRGLKKVTKTR